MTKAELIELLSDVPLDTKILIPMEQHFSGAFYSPCKKESGIHALGTDASITEEDIEEMQLLNKPIPEKDYFLLIPCGFYENEPNKNLN